MADSPCPSDDIPDVFQVASVSVQLAYQELVGNTSNSKKGAKPKTQNKTKNKEFAFAFENTLENYLSFLSSMLTKHGFEKYTPVTNRRRYGL